MLATGGVILTAAGSLLISRSLELVKPIEFTHMKIGTGDISSIAQAKKLNDLVASYKNINMSTLVRNGDLIRIRGSFTNKELSEAIRIKEVGVFAKIGTEQPILFGYINEGEGELIPPGSGGNIIARVRDLYIGITSEAEVAITINKSLVYATIEDLEEGLNRKEDKFVKRSGFNLDKTDLTENNSNKVFTPKGALNLFNTLTTNFTNGVNAAKEVLRLDIVKKLDKGNYDGKAQDLKADIDTKEPIIIKKTGFNLDKTDSMENNSNKVFTPKGALNLFNTLTTNFTNAVNAAKETLRGEITTKEPKFTKNSGFNKVKTDLVENDTNKVFSAKGAFDLKNLLVTNYTTLINNTRDSLLNMVNTKEPIISKKSGFNLDKTDSLEDTSNKVFTPKGALNLFNTLTTNFTNAVNAAKETLRGEIATKEPKFTKNSGFNKVKTDLAENDTNKIFSAKGALDLKTSLENLITNLKNTLTTHVGSLVSTTQSGHMSKEDKVKLNGIANNANNYILPKATASTVGGIKVGSNLSVTTDGTLSAPAPYTHPTTSGNKHIPTGGASNKFIKWLSDGTGTWDFIDWSFIQNKPSSFPPTSHSHTPSQVGLGNVPNTAHTAAATANTVPLRDAAGDITARLFRSSYQYENRMTGGVAFRVSTTDNYIRFCNDITAFKTWLGLQNVPNYAATSSVSDASNAILATAGAVKTAYDKGVQALNEANSRDKVTGKSSGTTGYRIYLDGFKEAWGSLNNDANEGTKYITLPFTFTTTDYNVSCSCWQDDKLDAWGEVWKDSTSRIRYRTNTTNASRVGTRISWYVCGY